MKTFITLCISLFIFAQAQAGLLFNYSQLALKDLDQMNKLVRTKITESQKSGGDKVIPLKEALQAVFSRPNDDFLIEKILQPLKNELEEHDAWEKTMQALVKEATGALKNPRAFQPVVQSTYLVFLENVISEFKPKLDDPFERTILTQIKDSKVKLPKEVVRERKLRVMRESISPSDLADMALKTFEEEEAKKKASAPVEVEAPVEN